MDVYKREVAVLLWWINRCLAFEADYNSSNGNDHRVGTHVPACAGRRRLNVEDSARVVHRRALMLVWPWGSWARLDEIFFVVLGFAQDVER